MSDTIVVNGRFLTQRLTGVQRYALELTRGLSHLTDVEVVAPEGALEAHDLGAARLRQTGRLHGHAWEQISLSRDLRAHGTPLLLSLASTGPLAYRRQFVAHHDITYVRHPESFSRPFRLLYGALVPPLLRRVQGVITVSEFSRSELHDHYRLDPAHIAVIPNAVSDVFTRDGTAYAAGEPYLLAVSSPNVHKNFARLVQAFERASTSYIGQLLIVGAQQGSSFAGADVAGVDAATTGTPNARANRITFLGRVDDDRLAELYRGAAAFAFPSIYEGFGIPPLEAQRSGTPVIAARAASIPEVLGDSALWFDPFDVADIARAIETIDQDAALRADLTSRGLANAAHFSWEASAAHLLDLVRARG